MKKNVGTVDKVIRIVIGLVVLGLGYTQGAWWGWIGLVPLLTGLIGWCPLYCPFKCSSCKK